MRISEFLERRKFPRALINAEVKLSQTPSTSWQGLIYLFTTNISAGGIFIETPTPIEIGKEVNISLVLPNGETLKDLIGKVVRNQDRDLSYHLGVGLEFINLGDQYRQILQAYVSNEQEQEKVIRRILKEEPVKLLLPSAQYRVLTNPDLDVVLKVAMTYEEIYERLMRWWGWAIKDKELAHKKVDQETKRLIQCRDNSNKIVRERMLKSKGIYFIKELKELEFTEVLNHESGREQISKMDSVIIQKKADIVLSDALKKYYQDNLLNEVKYFLNETIRQTFEEMWAYGVYDYSNAFVSNWGIDYLEGGFNLRLFDLWEIMDKEEIIRQRLSIPRDEVLTYIKTSWEYYDRVHPFSLFNLTGTDMVDWFKEQILAEYTVDKFEKYWCCKIKPENCS